MWFAESIPAPLKYFYTSFKGCRLKEIKCSALLNGFALVGELILFSYLLQMLCTGWRRTRRPASSVCSLTSFKCTGWRRTGSVLLPPSRQCCCLEDRFCSLTSCKTVLLSGGQVLFSYLLQDSTAVRRRTGSVLLPPPSLSAAEKPGDQQVLFSYLLQVLQVGGQVLFSYLLQVLRLEDRFCSLTSFKCCRLEKDWVASRFWLGMR